MSTMPPTQVGDQVRFICYGGPVRQWMVDQTGTVTGFNSSNHPIIMLHTTSTSVAHTGSDQVVVVDREGCGRLINSEGVLLRQRKENR